MRKVFTGNDLLRDGAYVLIGAVTVNLFNYVYHALIGRALGPERYGAVTSLLAALAIVSVPAQIATTVIVTYASEFVAREDVAHIRGLILRVSATALTVGAALFVAGALLAYPVARYLRIDDVPAVVTMALVVALNAAVPPLRGILQGMQRFRSYAASMAMEAVGRALFGAALVTAGFGVIGAIGGYAIAMALTLLYTRVAAGPSDGASPVRLDPARVWGTAGTSTVAILCLTILGFGDLILVKHYFDPYLAGLYGAIALSGKLLLFAVGFIPQVVLPKAAGRAATGLTSRALFLQAGAAIALASGALLAVLAVAPGLVLRILVGGAYLAAAPFVLSYGIAMACLAITTLIANFEIARHRFRFALPLALAALGEVVAIVFDHRSVQEVVRIVVAANAFAALVAGLDLALVP